jgi:hypothetical protein
MTDEASILNLLRTNESIAFSKWRRAALTPPGTHHQNYDWWDKRKPVHGFKPSLHSSTNHKAGYFQDEYRRTEENFKAMLGALYIPMIESVFCEDLRRTQIAALGLIMR